MPNLIIIFYHLVFVLGFSCACTSPYEKVCPYIQFSIEIVLLSNFFIFFSKINLCNLSYTEIYGRLLLHRHRITAVGVESLSLQ